MVKAIFPGNPRNFLGKTLRIPWYPRPHMVKAIFPGNPRNFLGKTLQIPWYPKPHLVRAIFLGNPRNFLGKTLVIPWYPKPHLVRAIFPGISKGKPYEFLGIPSLRSLSKDNERQQAVSNNTLDRSAVVVGLSLHLHPLTRTMHSSMNKYEMCFTSRDRTGKTMKVIMNMIFSIPLSC